MAPWCSSGNTLRTFIDCSGIVILHHRYTRQVSRCRKSQSFRHPWAYSNVAQLSTESMAMRSALISAKDLFNKLGKSCILDCTWYPPGSKARPVTECIPGAVRVDIDGRGWAHIGETLPHMLPSSDEFVEHVVKRNIIDSSRPVVVYSDNGFVASARVWWLLRAFGFDNCQVLNGGLRSWRDGGFPTDPVSDTSSSNEKCRDRLPNADGIQATFEPFAPHFRPQLVRTMSQILQNITEPRETVLDARSKGRFDGTAPEPRKGLPSGHIPGSLNVPFDSAIDSGTGQMKPREQLLELFNNLDVQQKHHSDRPRFVVSCGSGVTAPIIALALSEIGYRDVPCYDGSWTEYADPSHSNPIHSNTTGGSS